MSLVIATPSIMRRSARSGQGPGAAGGGPRLVLVRSGHPYGWSPEPPRPAPPLRLTRRGRLVARAAVVLLALIVLVGGVLLVTRSASAGGQSRPVPVTYHVVMPGETLWQIAGEVAPGADRRDTVADLIELNALPSAAVGAGDRIAVPVRPR